MLDIPQLSMDLSMNRVQRDIGVAMLDMSLENASSQGDALIDVMRSSMELSVNPDIGANIDVSV
ncbi:MAG: YjfB family protein [Lachnospiraceae bacterium]|nr:YjfB family protein [Lachnospiraceae bacterium]